MAQWKIDPAHSSAEFTVKHMMITTVRGNFSGIEGVISFDMDNPAAASVEATIPADTIDTGVEDRNNHLKSPDFFDVATYPTLSFKSLDLKLHDDKSGTLTGQLTMQGVTQKVTLDVAYIGESSNPMTGDRTVGFEASTKLNREDFGLTWNVALESGGVLVSKDVKVSLDIQAVLVQEAEAV